MAQQKLDLGKVVAEIPDAGDATHAVYILNGKPTRVDKVAEASKADSAGSASKATEAEKIGTGTVGSDKAPVYIKDGVPTQVTMGSSSDILLGDGTTKTIEQFIEENIETIREKLGVATTQKSGLTPQLPESPQASE